MEPRQPAVRMQWGLQIPTPEGVQLSATLYLPAGRRLPRPAIFVLTPYVAQVHHEQGVFFARHGYSFLTVDVRGRGNSQGVFHPLNDADDGGAVIEWLAQQPFCNGRVAMWGGSYSGYSQWATASRRPPNLATIVPVASPYRGVDSPIRNNICTPYMMRWLTYLSGRTAQDRVFSDLDFWTEQFKHWFCAGKPFRELDTFLGNPSPLFQEWMEHPERDAYWDGYNPTPEQYRAVDVPILTITGMYDADQLGALAHYREHMKQGSVAARERHFLIIGPWDHSGTRTPKLEFAGLKVGVESLVDLPKLHVQWYDWVMQDGPRPAFLKNSVAYYVMGADRWRYASSLEHVTARHLSLHLHSTINPTSIADSGFLAEAPSTGGGPDSYIYDPRDVSLVELECTVPPEDRADHRMVQAAAGKQLVYQTAPFEQATEISGFFKAILWLSIDQPDTDFKVSIYEVDEGGGALSLTADWMKARYRRSARRQELIDSTEPRRYDFENFMFVSRLVKAGCSLRLVIAPINSIHMQKNYNSGKPAMEESLADARVVTVRLFHDQSCASVLYAPVGQPEG